MGCFAAIRAILGRSWLILLVVFGQACWSGAGVGIKDPGAALKGDSKQALLVLNTTTTFYNYLPESPAPSKTKCLLTAGSYSARSKPWKLEGGDWVFINFLTKPAGCETSLGYVPSTTVDETKSTMQNFLRDSAVRSHRPSDFNSSTGTDLGREIAEWYGKIQNFDVISKEVYSWFGQSKVGCVAYASTVLRRFGVSIPHNGIYEGDLVSLDTKPFVNYLLKERHWKKIENPADALPGDIGVTIKDSVFKEYPTHIYFLSRWISKEEGVVEVIDNQGFAHPRTLGKVTPKNQEFGDFDPTDFFIRPAY